MTHPNEITPQDDVIDSRDVISRVEYLSELAIEESGASSEEIDELAALMRLVKMCENDVSDWQYGAALVNESYWQNYAEQYADDVIDQSGTWPFNHIDWEAAADELAQDYTQYEWEGVTFYVR